MFKIVKKYDKPISLVIHNMGMGTEHFKEESLMNITKTTNNIIENHTDLTKLCVSVLRDEF